MKYEIIITDRVLNKESYHYTNTIDSLAEELYTLFEDGVDVADIKINQKRMKKV